ncbi:hypothetical protein EJ08DRAFT_645418 [Tothia fuscella]|uniref:SCN5A-like C-terminal IQ motif domain-containing protein n=1 Tax=Tothia fuscella TaxID=1048955 RepID=A0A9P4P315_9PEZI|nr:hypothetical protein EJ08DRAFT_645418 [Tothia fuscella]
MPIPLWILERFHDFGKLCPFCEEATPGADVRQEQRRRRLPTLLRRLLFSSRKMEEERAAALIQRNYRGYRERRQLSGLHLSASDRWKEALKECQLRRIEHSRDLHSREEISAEK